MSRWNSSSISRTLQVFLGMGEPPLEIVAYSSRRFFPFRLKQNNGKADL